MLQQLENTWEWRKKLEKVKTDDEIQRIIGEFSGWAINIFSWVSEHQPPKVIRTTLKRLDKLARTLVMASDGIIEDFRLSEDWFKMIIAQLAVDGAEDEGKDVEDFINNYLSVLWKSYGWDVEKSLNPLYNNVTTTMNLRYKRDDGEGTLKILLEPVSKYPIGSVYKSKAEKLWELLDIENNAVLMVEYDPDWNPKKEPLRKFKEIKIPFALFAEMKRIDKMGEVVLV